VRAPKKACQQENNILINNNKNDAFCGWHRTCMNNGGISNALLKDTEYEEYGDGK
jgi:hypothetical protein